MLHNHLIPVFRRVGEMFVHCDLATGTPSLVHLDRSFLSQPVQCRVAVVKETQVATRNGFSKTGGVARTDPSNSARGHRSDYWK